MARTASEIENDIIAGVQNDPVLQPELTSTSSVAIWRRWARIVADCVHVVETLWDKFKEEVRAMLAALKPHTPKWYAEKALAYQHGFSLLQDKDIYDNSGYSAAQIEQSKIVKFAACTEEIGIAGRVILRIKLAALSGVDLSPLQQVQLDGVKAYFKRIKDAGVALKIDSLPADSLKMNWTVFYDPLILDANGSRLDGSDPEPVKKAIKNYLLNLPFNGLYILTYHVDAVQKVDGVVFPVIDMAEANYGNLPYGVVNYEYQPDAGYLRFNQDSDLVINYLPHDAIQ